MRVTAIDRESTTVISVTMVPSDGQAAVPARPGQFLTLRLHPDPEAAPLLRTYSLSGMPSADSYRISVKREPHGAASEYLHDRLRVGDVIDVGAPRGSFVLRAGDRPVVLISAGVGATPVLAMLHVLAAAPTTRGRCGGCTVRATAPSTRSRTRRADCSASSPTHTTSFATANPMRSIRGSTTAGGSRPKRSTRRAFPWTPTSICVDRRRSCTNLTAALIERGTAAERISTEVFGAAASITARRRRRAGASTASSGGRRQDRAQ